VEQLFGDRARVTVWDTGLKEALTFREHVRENLNKEFIIIIIIIVILFQSIPLHRAITWILNTQKVNKLLVNEGNFWRRSVRKSRKKSFEMTP